jgi:dTDP-4-dehydrorhamnose reductase
MKILVTGAAGQVGSAVVERFERSGNHEVVAATRDVMDLADRDAVLQVITTVAPDAIVHSGAFTAVDACETEVDTALRINALATRHVVDGADRVDARVLYISTDYVFDGTKSGAYDEWDIPNPQSVYGRSKLGGERETRTEDTVVRTSWVFGKTGKNMVKTVLRLAQTNPELAFVNDQHGKPTCAEDLAETIYDLTVSRSPGVFHVTNAGPTTWHGFAQEVLRAAGESPDRVAAISTADLAGKYPAPRPANSVLDNAALRLNGIPELRHFTEALAETIKVIKNA